jgi:hypothetical protein
VGYVHFPNISVPNCSLHYSTVQSNAEQCGSAQCRTEQSSTVLCSVLQCCSALSLERASGRIKSCSCRESGVAQGEERSLACCSCRAVRVEALEPHTRLFLHLFGVLAALYTFHVMRSSASPTVALFLIPYSLV